MVFEEGRAISIKVNATKTPKSYKKDFKAKDKNQKLYIFFINIYLIDGAKRYYCSILDFHDKSILASLNSKQIDSAIAIKILKFALYKNPKKGNFILHSEQEEQFTSQAFTEFCEENKIVQSMSKAGCPYDNSLMERFYGKLKSEIINKHKFETDEIMTKKILENIWGYYNHIRPHYSNGNLTPFEKRHKK